MCVRMHVYSCSAALPAQASQTLLPERSPVGLGSRNSLIGLTVLSSSCSPILSLKCAHTHTHMCTAHIHTCPTVLIFVLHLPQNSFKQSWSYTATTRWSESERIQFTYPQVNGVKADVSLCVVLYHVLPAFLFKSLKGEREYTIYPFPGLGCRQVQLILFGN